MKKIYFLLLTLLISSLSYGQLVINEIDADTPGSDTAEFLELKWTPNTSLTGYIVVFFNGSNDLSYATIDLVGKTTDANGFFILANESLATGDDIIIPAGGSGFIQNGPDAVAIYQDVAATFPVGSSTTMTNLIDALVYGTADPDDAELLTGLGETVQYDESVNSASATESIQRKTDGTYETKAPTFRASNDAAVCELSFTSTTATCDAFTPGTDTYSVAIDFSGGGTSTYTVTSTSGTVGGDDPSSMATGTITVTGVSEGTDITVNVTDGGLCDLDSMVTSPSCNSTLTLPITENFSYPDGSLVGNSTWENHSGTVGDLLVTSGQALVQHGTPSEDASLPFVPVTGNLYYAFDMTVQNPGGPITATDNEYFAHFKNSTFGFFGRLDIVAPTGAGDYSVGIATINGTADATWATDLTFGSTYRVTVRYDQDTNIAQLWLDAASESDPSILGADEADPGDSIASFALRQSDSGENEGILVDNLVIAQTFAQTTLSTPSFTTDVFNVYPNPTSVGYVNISTSNGEAMSVNVFDVLGKQVLNQTVSNNRLNVSTLKSGIYIIRISQNDTIVTKKLIIK